MSFTRDSREHALVLLQMAQEYPGLKSQIVHLACQWLALAAVQDMIAIWAEETDRRTATLH